VEVLRLRVVRDDDGSTSEELLLLRDEAGAAEPAPSSLLNSESKMPDSTALDALLPATARIEDVDSSPLILLCVSLPDPAPAAALAVPPGGGGGDVDLILASRRSRISSRLASDSLLAMFVPKLGCTAPCPEAYD
jgi:hypothetical protein